LKNILSSRSKASKGMRKMETNKIHILRNKGGGSVVWAARVKPRYIMKITSRNPTAGIQLTMNVV